MIDLRITKNGALNGWRIIHGRLRFSIELLAPPPIILTESPRLQEN
jgi:hypothetical protein